MLKHIEQQYVINDVIRKRQLLRIPENAGPRLVPVARGVKIVEANVLALSGQVPARFPVCTANIENHTGQVLARNPEIPVLAQEREPLRMKRRLFQ